MPYRFFFRFVVLIACAAFMGVPCARGLAARQAPALLDFIDRAEVAEAQLPLIIAAAEAAAARKIKSPEALLNLTYHRQPSFAEELLNRSGGLAGALPSEERPALVTENDIVVFSVRSWEKNGAAAVAYLRECRGKG